MIILSESREEIQPSISAKENKLLTESAELLGCKVYYMPPNFDRCGTAENALYHIPKYAKETPGVWVGYIPERDRYQAIYKETGDAHFAGLSHISALEL